MPENNQHENGKYGTVIEIHDGKRKLEKDINQLISDFMGKLPTMVAIDSIAIRFSLDIITRKKRPFAEIKLDVDI